MAASKWRACAASAVVVALLAVVVAAAAPSVMAAPATAAARDAKGSAKVTVYIDKLTAWWPPSKIAGGMAVPGFAAPNGYTHVNLAFWLTSGPADAALVWANALTYVSAQNPWNATTNAEVQKAWAAAFHKAGKRVLVSAFGSTDMPTSAGADPVEVANKLAAFVKANHLDGVDLDYEDNSAMNAGTGEAWLIACTNQLRKQLPSPYIISHAPQAPYFMGPPRYPGGGYQKVDKETDIDFYNVQFYNQDNSKYDTFETAFVKSAGWANETSVCEIAALGVDVDKLLLGKPVGAGDAANTGYVPLPALATLVGDGVHRSPCKWRAGIMGWQFSSDADGTWSTTLSREFS